MLLIHSYSHINLQIFNFFSLYKKNLIPINKINKFYFKIKKYYNLQNKL